MDGLPISEEELNLLKELVARRVPFMLVGMGAAVVQGAAVMTQDLDLWFKSTSDPKIQDAARATGGTFVWRMTPPMFTGPGLDSVDVVVNCDGLHDFASEYGSALKIELAPGLSVKVLPIGRVMASKLAANRPKDRAVIPALEAAIAVLKEPSQ